MTWLIKGLPSVYRRTGVSSWPTSGVSHDWRWLSLMRSSVMRWQKTFWSVNACVVGTVMFVTSCGCVCCGCCHVCDKLWGVPYEFLLSQLRDLLSHVSIPEDYWLPMWKGAEEWNTEICIYSSLFFPNLTKTSAKYITGYIPGLKSRMSKCSEGSVNSVRFTELDSFSWFNTSAQIKVCTRAAMSLWNKSIIKWNRQKWLQSFQMNQAVS